MSALSAMGLPGNWPFALDERVITWARAQIATSHPLTEEQVRRIAPLMSKPSAEDAGTPSQTPQPPG